MLGLGFGGLGFRGLGVWGFSGERVPSSTTRPQPLHARSNMAKVGMRADAVQCKANSCKVINFWV